MTEGTDVTEAARDARPRTDGTEQAARVNRILLAEDDDELRAWLAAALRDDGYAVDEAENGMDLLAKLARSLLGLPDGGPVDVVVSDIRMPGFSGLEVLAALRNTDHTVPVILITAFGDEETHELAGRLGANAVIDKPFDVHQLRMVLSSIVPPS
jgi:DNA-binding response OmpR family regulator